ncbi:hypothetical protein AAVH_37731, partial [Aphelenchoides avenae]
MPADNSRQEGVEASEDEVEDHQPEESGQLQQPQKEQLVTSENEAESNGQMVPVDDQENRECVICLGRLEVPTTLKCCRHTFCFKCSEDWWKEMEEDTCCPVCRSAIQSVQMLLSDICVLLKEDEDHPLLYMAVREYEFRDVVSTMLAGSDSPGQAEAAAGEEEAVEEAPPPLIEEPPQPRH